MDCAPHRGVFKMHRSAAKKPASCEARRMDELNTARKVSGIRAWLTVKFGKRYSAETPIATNKLRGSEPCGPPNVMRVGDLHMLGKTISAAKRFTISQSQETAALGCSCLQSFHMEYDRRRKRCRGRSWAADRQSGKRQTQLRDCQRGSATWYISAKIGRHFVCSRGHCISTPLSCSRAKGSPFDKCAEGNTDRTLRSAYPVQTSRCLALCKHSCGSISSAQSHKREVYRSAIVSMLTLLRISFRWIYASDA